MVEKKILVTGTKEIEKRKCHEWYMKNRERKISQSKEWNEKHKNDSKFKSRKNLYQKEYRLKNKEKISRSWKDYQKRVTSKVLIHYSSNPPECTNCGFSNLEALTIDHLNNDGNRERATLKRRGTSFYLWLIKNNYPEGYQVLCMNCQFIKMKMFRRNKKFE